MHSMGKCAVRRTRLWLRLWFYSIQGFTNALWKKLYFWMAKCKINLFWLSSIILHCQKPLWMLGAFVKWAKRPQCLLFSTVKGGMNILRSYLNCSTIVNWKTRKRTNTLKGSQRMGGGGGFFWKPSATLSIMKTYRMSLISAGSISLDSTFKIKKHRLCHVIILPKTGCVWKKIY